MAMRKSSDPEVQRLRNNIELKIGMRINKLTIIEKIPGGYRCKCDCNNMVDITRPYRLKNELIGNVQDHVGSCGCIQKTKFVAANRLGGIQSSHQNTTLGGALIITETDYIDDNRSAVVLCKCNNCNNLFPTTKRSTTINCGCLTGHPTRTLSEYLAKKQYKSKNEVIIADLLTQYKINFIPNKKYSNCVDKTYLPFDFHVNNKYIIEFDGEQHFKIIEHWGGKEGLIKHHQHDLIKNKYCFDNNIPIIRIPYGVNYTIDDLKLETTRFLLTPENEKEYYELNKLEI